MSISNLPALPSRRVGSSIKVDHWDLTVERMSVEVSPSGELQVRFACRHSLLVVGVVSMLLLLLYGWMSMVDGDDGAP